MKKLCESKFGDKNCENEATESVVVNSQMFMVCKSCLKSIKKQNKANHDQD